MGIAEKLIWQIYSGVLGAAVTVAVQKLIVTSWNAATGEEPPNPNDPEVPYSRALAWALATGVGVGVTQMTINRYMSSRWAKNMGKSAPGTLRNKLTD